MVRTRRNKPTSIPASHGFNNNRIMFNRKVSRRKMWLDFYGENNIVIDIQNGFHPVGFSSCVRRVNSRVSRTNKFMVYFNKRDT